ncbi:MAG: hypothetical protein AAFQ89_24755 [Cyanobacteria bacterium J06626_18]
MTVLFNTNQILRPGMTVRILYPIYALGETGEILSREVIAEEGPSDYWLVKVFGERMVLALSPSEFQVIAAG